MSLIQIDSRSTPATLDVREIAPRDRHPLILGTFDRLGPGESFILLNDHDPKPLYYQFQAEQTGSGGLGVPGAGAGGLARADRPRNGPDGDADPGTDRKPPAVQGDP